MSDIEKLKAIIDAIRALKEAIADYFQKPRAGSYLAHLIDLLDSFSNKLKAHVAVLEKASKK